VTRRAVRRRRVLRAGRIGLSRYSGENFIVLGL
jgi:hypothetical protein